MRTHSLKACTLILAASVITEFGESDAIQIEPNSDAMAMAVSADGVAVFNSSNDNNYIATVTVKQTSFAYTKISAMIAAQQLAVNSIGRIPPMMFSWSNPATGDVVSCTTAVFLNLPSMLGNKDAGDIVFRVALPNAKRVHGAAITPLLGA